MGLPSTCASNLIGAKDTMSEQNGPNGGGEGSRTPVQYKFHINFYIVSLLLLILQTKLSVFPASERLRPSTRLLQVGQPYPIIGVSLIGREGLGNLPH